MTKEINLSADKRVIIRESWDTNFQYAVGDCVGFVWLNYRDGWKEYTPDGLQVTDLYTAENFLNVADTTYSYKETRLNAYARYLSLNGFDVARVLLIGYSQSEWAEAVVYCEKGDGLDDWVEKIRQWWRGDVYDLQAQTRKVFTAEDGETIEKWIDAEDGCFSSYLVEYGELTLELAEYVAGEMGWL